MAEYKKQIEYFLCVAESRQWVTEVCVNTYI